MVPSCEWSSAPALPEVQTSPPPHTHTPRSHGAAAPRPPTARCPLVPPPPLLLYSHGGAQASNWLAKELQPLLDGGMRGKPKGADMRPVLTSCFQQVGQGGGDE